MTKTFIIAVLLATIFTKCTPFKISMHENLAKAPELAVKGRNGILINQKLSFGEYKTAKVNRSWTSGSEYSAGAMKTLWVTSTAKKQKIHFSLLDSSNHISDVYCIARANSEDWTVGANENSIVNIMADLLGIGGSSNNTFGVNIYLPAENKPWEMLLDINKAQGDSKHYIGYLAQSKDRFYTIHPVTSVEKNGKKGVLPFGSVGFEVRSKSGIGVAAVSLMDNGKVYIAGDDSYENFLLANACAALLLHQTLD
ncbi:MAG TPA: hypothetical protein VF623_07970 [Segetibacter sp.]